MRSFGLILLFLGTIMIVSGYLKDKEKQNLAMKTKIVYRYIPKPLSAMLDDPPAVDNMFREISSSDPWMDTTATEREIFNMNNKPSKSAGDNSVPEYFCDVCNKCMYKEITITEDGQTYKKYKETIGTFASHYVWLVKIQII